MKLRAAYRSIVELDVSCRSSGQRVDGRFLIRDGWTLLKSGSSEGDIEVWGPSTRAQLCLRTALELDVLQRVGPVEGNAPDRSLGQVGWIGDLICTADGIGVVLTQDDQVRAIEQLRAGA